MIPGAQKSSYPTNNNNYVIARPTENSMLDDVSQQAIETLPDIVRAVLPARLNKMQLLSMQSIYSNSSNCVVCSPTGSGKTVLFELAMLQLYMRQNTSGEPKDYKVLYMAPTKALCTERHLDWARKFAPLNLTVGLLTSDTSAMETERVRKSDVIICTAEKWDLLTRRWPDYSRLFELVKLLLIDEVHVLKDKRGSTLEVVVTRMKRMCTQLRIIALSATVPNIEDIAKWLKKSYFSDLPADCLVFGEEFRAVRLNRFIYGVKNNLKNDYQFDAILNPKVLEAIRSHFNGKPVLIFCPTRAAAVSTAKYLNENCYGLFPSNLQGIPFKDRDLSNMAKNGIAFHHAGLSFEDRQAVERNFITGSTKVLCSTSTLAVGVNLPAFLVIIKGTKSWTAKGLTEYCDLDILQMIGRAGRPQFEKEGCAVILTDVDTKQKYERIVQGTEKLESCLHLNFAENLAAEVTLKTIDSVESALEWLKSTFFFIRYISNPSAYHGVKELRIGNFDLKARLLNFCEEKLNELLKEHIVIESQNRYQSTPYCDSMSRHYVLFETIKNFINCSASLSLKEVLKLFSDSSEFKEIRLKYLERKLFKEIGNSPLTKFPLSQKDPVGNVEKIFLLIQYELGGLEYPNYNGSLKLHSSFLNDKNYIFKQAPRIAKCMIDVLVEKKDAVSLLNCLKLARCISGKCWEDTAMVLRQLQGIGLAYVRKFASHNVFTLPQARALEANQIEYYLGMKPGNGNKIKKDLNGIPSFSVSAKMLKEAISKDLSCLEIEFEVMVTSQQESSTWHGKFLILDIVTVINNAALIDYRRIPISKIHGSKVFKLRSQLKKFKSNISVHICCCEIPGIHSTHRLDLSSIPEWKFNKLIPLVDENEQSHVEEVEVEDLNDFDDDDDNEIEMLLSKSETLKEVKPYQLREDGRYECNHACKDKRNCRHFCCKEGLIRIPGQPVIGCNHLCKDKRKCRHLCCKEAVNVGKVADSKPLEVPEESEKLETNPVKIIPVPLNKRSAPGPSPAPMKKMKKLPIGFPRKSLFDSEDESGEERIDLDDALDILLNEPKTGVLKNRNFHLTKQRDDSASSTEKIKGNSSNNPITIIDESSITVESEVNHIKGHIAVESSKLQESEKELKANDTWFNNYDLQLTAGDIIVEPEDAKEDSNKRVEDDSLLNFLGSDIEIG